MVISNQLELSVKKAQDINLICPTIISQTVAAEAPNFDQSWCKEKIKPLFDVCHLVLDELKKLSDKMEVLILNGLFYVWVKITNSKQCKVKNDMSLVRTLIEEYHVVVMPRSTFGIEVGMSLRIAYGALDTASVAEGMGRLTKGLSDLL